MVQDNSSIQAGRRMLRPCFGIRPAVLEFYGWKICKIRNPTRYLVQFTTSESDIRPSFKVFTLLYATRSFISIILKVLWIYHATTPPYYRHTYVLFLFLHFTRILYIITSDYFSFLLTRFLLFISPSCLTRRTDKGVRGKRKLPVFRVFSLELASKHFSFN